MELVNGKWQCLECGEQVDLPEGMTSQVVLYAASGQPNVRVLLVEGVEIHRCEVPPGG
jgi:hypothetical protein